MWIARLTASLLFLSCVIPSGVLAQFDELGNYPEQQPPGDASVPGDVCGTCKDPDPSVWGVEFRNDEMWLVSLRRTLYRMNGCELVSASPLSGMVLPAGLGYDSRRDLFVVTDASLNALFRVTPSGRVLGKWPTPGPGPVGAAYDSRRDLYWISDWEQDRLYTIDPNTGLPGPSLEIPAGSRISGTAYDPGLDALIYHSRDEALSYWISAQTGEILSVYVIPQRGQNNGQDAAVDPVAGSLWITHAEEPSSYCLNGLDNEERERHGGPGRGRGDPIAVEETSSAPTLQGAYPNPFNPVTRIRYALPSSAFVVLYVFDVRGRIVETLVNETRPAGEHVVEWRAHSLASGVYFCRLVSGEYSSTRRLILLK